MTRISGEDIPLTDGPGGKHIGKCRAEIDDQGHLIVEITEMDTEAQLRFIGEDHYEHLSLAVNPGEDVTPEMLARLRKALEEETDAGQ